MNEKYFIQNKIHNTIKKINEGKRKRIKIHNYVGRIIFGSK